MISNKKINWMFGILISFFVCSALFCAFMAIYYTGTIGKTPHVGDYYVAKWEQKDPFAVHNTNTILAVKQGYVQYKNQFGIRSDTLSSFRVCYTYVGRSPEKP